jgi:DNA-directed RNA polymerase subunit RPC12/RpoP
MATTNLPDKKQSLDETMCPKCRSGKLLFIEGELTQWATCPNCKFKKLVAKKDSRTVRVTPLLKPDSNFK